MRLLPFLALLATATAAEPPQPFTINCSACHLLDQSIVGPSLVEIAKVYKDKPEDFVAWCIEPGKKRPNAIQMPSMAHVAPKDLTAIHHYIQTATVGVTEKKTKTGDPYAETAHATRRPRIQRTFLPHAGPASLYIAMPGEAKLNMVWDTDLCRLRYITEGEPDDWPYFRSNGNSLSKIGKTLYTEEERPFSLNSEDLTTTFKGYRLNPDGLPTFLYQLGPLEVSETITGSNNTISRTISITGDHKLIDFRKITSAPLAPVIDRSDKDAFTITHTKK